MSELGGGEFWILRTARLLGEWGHGVMVVCPYRSRLFHECLREGQEVYAFYNVNGSPFYAPLVHALEKRRIDLVHATVIGGFCESAVLSRALAKLNARRSNSPACLVYIGYNGDVLLCCMDRRRRVVLGNARLQSLREIWRAPAYQRYRRLHQEDRSGELQLCTDCTYTRS
jgi:radical SAM protein with 4Fe4S-binding SPASM domain